MEQMYDEGVRSVSGWEARLWEAFDALWDGFVDPSEALVDAEGKWWTRLGGEDGASGAALGSEQELREARAQCRMLAVTNEFAINGHENRVSYVVGTGHTYRATARKGFGKAYEALAGRVQGVVDEFCRVNQWHKRQQEIVRRRDRDGEAFLRFFVPQDGVLRVRFVEPGQVATPAERAGDAAATFGIQTAAGDVEEVLWYWVDGEAVAADEMQHRKAHVDANVKRGLPLFYPVRKNLRRAERILRNMSVVAEIQSAIALIRRHKTASRSGVQQFVSDQAEATVQRGSGKTTTLRRYGPGTILDAYGGVEYDFPAAGIDAANFVAILQAELRAIASRLVMPEFMLSSDASNANYASTMVAEGPAVKMFERLQAELVREDLEVLWRAVRTAVCGGRLPREAEELVEIQASAPSLTVRDALEEAQVARMEFESGILSPQTWSVRRGLDYDQEQQNLAAHRGSGVAETER